MLILCSASFSLSNFRGDFIEHLIRHGFKVYCGAPDFTPLTLGLVEKLGGTPIRYNLQRTGLNPLKDIKTVKEIRAILDDNNIDIVFPYTIKPVIYGSFAANKKNIPVISLITGLGFTFSRITFKARILQKMTQYLYRKALRNNAATVFQNIDDLELFVHHKIVRPNQSLHVVDGSGINLNRFAFRENSKDEKSTIRFVLVGRLLKEKGVGLFINAAKKIRPDYPNIEFHLIGAPPKNNVTAISLSELKALDNNGTIKYHGETKDVGDLLSTMDIFVLPSYYREGVPRSILEALSIGMPIITTQQPGCKETVIENVNGFLIPPQQEQPLLDALYYFIKNPSSISSMGLESRKLAEKKFDVKIINKNLLKIIDAELEKLS